MPDTTALIVFAKVPVAGSVKTRLAKDTSPADAAALYRAFLEDSLSQYAELEIDVLLYVAPSVTTMPVAIASQATATFVQDGASLGSRMSDAFSRTFGNEYGRVLIIGTDHPTLPSAYIREAIDYLIEPKSIVIGPSTDGGFYLLGMNSYYPTLFEGMSYSNAHVYRETMTRILSTSARHLQLAEWYDVDTKDSLIRLCNELRDQSIDADETRKVLAAIGPGYSFLSGLLI